MPERTLAKIGDKGRLVVPLQIRNALGLKSGDILDLRVVDGELRITSLRERILRARELRGAIRISSQRCPSSESLGGSL